MIANCQNFRIVVVNVKNNNDSVGLSVDSCFLLAYIFGKFTHFSGENYDAGVTLDCIVIGSHRRHKRGMG